MDIEACNIIDLHLELQSAFPFTQLLWHPSRGNTTYSNNFVWSGIKTSELIDSIKRLWPGEPELIQLTLKDGIVYFK